MDPEIEKKLEPLRLRVKEQGDKVREMKKSGAPAMDVKKEVNELMARKKELDELAAKLSPPEKYDRNLREKMLNLIKRRFIYNQSFSIYGSIAGQYDFGPFGCKLTKNMLKIWDSHFVQRESMLEVDCSILTPEQVLKASGHVEKFADFMVKDVVNGECYRLDHLIKLNLEKKRKEDKVTAQEKEKIDRILSCLDGMNKEQLGSLVTEYEMKATNTGNALSPPEDFNLMFPISIGPTGAVKGFLRPETAQGIFINFKSLLESKRGKLPFAVAQVGKAYRNEISPRSGLLRVREFLMAEIEHFCFPDDKDHPKFDEVRNVEVLLYSACAQMDGKSAFKTTIGEAVDQSLIANETLGYYMARIQQFLLKIGIDSESLRFRQHMSNEMAHYACDCWDAECLTSHGWIECVGCADRSAFDLNCHSIASGENLSVERPLAQPVEEEIVVPNLAKSVIGKSFKKDAKQVQELLAKLSIEEVKEMDSKLEQNGTFTLPGSQYEVNRAMVPSIKQETRKKHVEEIVPSVIEPSFGVGRVFYALLEHTFKVREDDENRTYFALPALVAPIKVSVLPLSSNSAFTQMTKQIANSLTAADLSVEIDDSAGSIGRRYARTDEMSIPFAVTVDFDSLTSESVTLRERDSTQQIRLPILEVVGTVCNLVKGLTSWQEVSKKWPKFTQQEATK